MPFGLTPNVFNPVDVMATFADEYVAVVDPAVVKLRNIQHIIHLNTVCVGDAIRQDLLSDNENQRRCCAFGIMTVYTVPPRFKRPKTGIFPAAPLPRRPLRTPPK